MVTKELFKISIPAAVAWGKMDAFQHVNNTVYFKYFETARTKFMEDSGMLGEMKKSNIGPILGKIECSFLQPLVYPDNLELCARVTHIGNTSFTVQHAVFSASKGLVAIGDGIVVMLDYNTNSKTPITVDIRKILDFYS